MTGRLYGSGGRVVFVSSPDGCPRINLMVNGKSVKLRDDFSKGFKTSKLLLKTAL